VTIYLPKGLIMNEKLLEYLNGNTHLYPSSVAVQFPTIIDKLISLWETTEIDKYIESLLFDTRGDRQGFPPEVANELWKLHHYRLKLSAENAPSMQQDYWSWIHL
jgi:hypothetical protein